MDQKQADRILELTLKIISYILIPLALFSLIGNIIVKNYDIYTFIMLLLEGLSIVSFFYAYYLYAKKEKSAPLFIIIPLSIFFLYIIFVTSYNYPIGNFGIISCIILLLSVNTGRRVKLAATLSVLGVTFIIYSLQLFELIPPLYQRTKLYLPDKIVILIIIFIMGLALYTYYINSLSRGSIEKLFKQYEAVLEFAAKNYGYTEREREIARCLIQGMSNVEITDKFGITNSTVKAHVKHVLDKSRIKKRANFYDKLLEKYHPLTETIKRIRD